MNYANEVIINWKRNKTYIDYKDSKADYLPSVHKLYVHVLYAHRPPLSAFAADVYQLLYWLGVISDPLHCRRVVSRWSNTPFCCARLLLRAFPSYVSHKPSSHTMHYDTSHTSAHVILLPSLWNVFNKNHDHRNCSSRRCTRPSNVAPMFGFVLEFYSYIKISCICISCYYCRICIFVYQ